MTNASAIDRRLPLLLDHKCLRGTSSRTAASRAYSERNYQEGATSFWSPEELVTSSSSSERRTTMAEKTSKQARGENGPGRPAGGATASISCGEAEGGVDLVRGSSERSGSSSITTSSMASR